MLGGAYTSRLWISSTLTRRTILQGVQRLRIMTHMPDGSTVPKGFRRVYLDNTIFDSMLNLVASLLEDPTNSFLYPSNEPWTDPAKLVENLIFAYYQVYFLLDIGSMLTLKLITSLEFECPSPKCAS
jgi:hypothetical protein